MCPITVDIWAVEIAGEAVAMYRRLRVITERIWSGIDQLQLKGSPWRFCAVQRAQIKPYVYFPGPLWQGR